MATAASASPAPRAAPAAGRLLLPRRPTRPRTLTHSTHGTHVQAWGSWRDAGDALRGGEVAASWRTVAALGQTRYGRKSETWAEREGRSLPTGRRNLISLATGAEVGSNWTAEHLGAGSIRSGRSCEALATGVGAESCLKISEIPERREGGSP